MQFPRNALEARYFVAFEAYPRVEHLLSIMKTLGFTSLVLFVSIAYNSPGLSHLGLFGWFAIGTNVLMFGMTAYVFVAKLIELQQKQRMQQEFIEELTKEMGL